MLGTIVNTVAIIAGGGIGLLLKKGNGEKVSVAEGFVTASLLFCVGAMGSTAINRQYH